MSAPVKPWEGSGTDPSLCNAADIGSSAPSFLNPSPSSSLAPAIPPPLPPRLDLAPQGAYGAGMGAGLGYGTGMGAYGALGGGYGGMGSYGGYGMGMGGYGGGYGGGFGSPMYGGYNRMGPGMYGDAESRFIQLAEESSRPAFDSIGSVVQAVGSVAMMLDNTFMALTSSFRAILGVAENFGRLRSLFAQVWTSLAVVRSINWLMRKLLVMLGIRTNHELKAWAEALRTEPAETRTGAAPRTSAWPALMFFGVVAAAPYFLLKLMGGLHTSAAHEKLEEPASWREPMQAVALHEFTGSTPRELNVRARQLVWVAPQQLHGALWGSGWVMASTDRRTAGLLPANYIKLVPPGAALPSISRELEPTSAPASALQEPEPTFTPASALHDDELEKYYKDQL